MKIYGNICSMNGKQNKNVKVSHLLRCSNMFRAWIFYNFVVTFVSFVNQATQILCGVDFVASEIVM